MAGAFALVGTLAWECAAIRDLVTAARGRPENCDATFDAIERRLSKAETALAEWRKAQTAPAVTA